MYNTQIRKAGDGKPCHPKIPALEVRYAVWSLELLVLRLVLVKFSVNGTESSAYLQQCGDSYSSWRRIRLTQQLPERREPKAWILHLTPLAATNLCLAGGFKGYC